MIKQILKIAVRKHIKDRMGLWFQLLGLTLGLAAVFLILLVVANNIAVDKHITHLGKKYRVLVHDSTHHWDMGQCPFPLAPQLVSQSPAVANATRIFNLSEIIAGKDSRQKIDVSSAFCADSSFFSMFTVRVLSGKPSETGIMVSESVRQKIFGKESALNEYVQLSIQGKVLELPVAGVYKDITPNASVIPEIVLPIEVAFDLFHLYFSSSDPNFADADHRNDWGLLGFSTFIELNDHEEAITLPRFFSQVTKEHVSAENKYRFYVQPLKEVYLNSDDIKSNNFRKGNMRMLYILLAVCGFVSLIIMVNYLIQNTAFWVIRSREIGMRKVLGARFSHLFTQVVVESLLVFVVVSLMALIAVEQFRALLENLAGMGLTMNAQVWHWFLPGLIIVFAFMVFVPVSYVVFYLNRLPVTSIFMQKIKMNGFSSVFRNMLLGIQYVVFIILFIASVGIFCQIKYTNSIDLGYNDENLLMFTLQDKQLHAHFESLKQELKQQEVIIGVSGAMWLPPTDNTLSLSTNHPQNKEMSLNFEGLFVDEDFPGVMEMRALPGYSLDKFKEVGNGIIINESAMDLLDMGNPEGESLFMGPIVAVVEDFHVHSLRDEIKPLLLVKMPQMTKQVLVRYQPHRRSEAVEVITQVVERLTSAAKLEIEDVNERLAILHKQDYMLARSITGFALVALLIGCMGLLAITRFMLQRQQKSLAIRKVNGASVKQILGLIAGGFSRIIVGACIVGFPLAYLLVQWWFSRFAYAVGLAWWSYVLALLVVLIVTAATLWHVALRTARMNPALVLRNE